MALKHITARLIHPVLALDQWWYRVSPERRLDHNFGNMFMLVGLMLPTASIIATGPTPNSVLNDMPEWLQIWMCAFIFFGCGIKLFGALSGTKFFRPKAKTKHCYRYGFIGAPLATSGTIVYGYFILSGTENFWSALSGISTPMFGLGISGQAVLYWLEWRRIAANEAAMIRQAKMAKGAET